MATVREDESGEASWREDRVCKVLMCGGLGASSEFPDTKVLQPTALHGGGGPGPGSPMG